MAFDRVQQTNLWRSAFSERQNDLFASQRKRLANSLESFRGNVEPIVQRIAHVLPGLTLHDVSHLDALWETADVIAGDGYPLNPLEAFVFGAAILLHDSAMCWEAYEHGQQGVRDTVEWKDAYADECDKWPSKDDVERRAVADFAALRALHAHQAERLPELTWRHPDTNQELYLIEDALLRTELGGLVGKIASSHHWDVDTLTPRLGGQFNAPSAFSADWSVDPIKVAGLLRCADATHINQARAPLLLYALVKRQGVSLQHWKAQNRMMGPSLDSGDPSGGTIVYTSSRPFRECDAQAWWIAHDAVAMVDKELQLTNALLKSRERERTAPEFRVKRVKGAASLEDLTSHLRVEGWAPCKAEPHVSNVESLVRELGGEKLYGAGGDKVEIVLRELIQNARDAIVARRFIEPAFDGEVSIRLEVNGSERWLCVDDNGVGMSRRVLTGPLLDFGNSLWKSSLVQSEFPGLRSSQFRSVGRFGIGFYSIFMIADQVTVSSRNWDKGLDDCNTLIFNNGVSLRPILRPGRPDGFPSSVSTRLRLLLKPSLLTNDSAIEVKPNVSGVQAFLISLPEFVSALVVGMDVRVNVSCPSFSRAVVHGGNPGEDPEAKEILRKISFASKQPNALLSEVIEGHHARLRPIRSDGLLLGFAAISTGIERGAHSMLSMSTVGGLATSVCGRHVDSFIGYVAYRPESARRGPAEFEAPPDVITAWAADQLRILEDSNVSDLERCFVGIHACAFGFDPIAFARSLVSVNETAHQFMTYDQLAVVAESLPVAVFKMSGMDFVDTHNSVQSVPNVALIRPLAHGIALELRFNDGVPLGLNGIVGCLHRAIVARGRLPAWTVQSTTHLSIFREPLELLMVSSLAPE